MPCAWSQPLPVPARCFDLSHTPLQGQLFSIIVFYFRYDDVRLSSGSSCLLLEARCWQTYQLTAFKPQPQLSQRQIVKLLPHVLWYTASCTLRRDLSSSCCHTRYLGIASNSEIYFKHTRSETRYILVASVQMGSSKSVCAATQSLQACHRAS